MNKNILVNEVPGGGGGVHGGHIQPTDYCPEVVMFSLCPVRKTIITRHTRIARRGRDGARKDRSTGWSPQAHSGHVVGRTSYSASRPLHWSETAPDHIPSLSDLHHGANEVLPGLSVLDPYVPASILASGRVDELTLAPPYTPSYGGRVNVFHMKGLSRRGLLTLHMTSFGIGTPTYCPIPSATAPVRDSRHTHQTVLLWTGRVLHRLSLHTLPLQGNPS